MFKRWKIYKNRFTVRFIKEDVDPTAPNASLLVLKFVTTSKSAALKNSCKKEFIFHTFVDKAWSVHCAVFDKITPPQSLRITF